MLQLLTFLLGKLSLLSIFKHFESSCADAGEDRERHVARDPSPPPPPLRRGDLLEVHRTVFTHYGIYLGDNKVAHLIPDILPVFSIDKELIGSVVSNKRLILGCIYRCATVRVDTLEDFAYGAHVLVNHMDTAMRSNALPNEDVAQRAERLVGAVPYSLLWYNCEHFVTGCRYGAAESRQTDKFCEGVKSVIRDQRSVIFTSLLGIISIVCFGMAPSTTLPTVLIPFTLWMAG
ncbi:Lecithin retinol acyltransferase [Liparis tanakae]|uniref:Lecithin retinol acyltransferase n=1 Tax=Liparis tanakae TaxID=230148 RepID=A0A4Z2JIB2_9TELE|nr:Lecithin retinol acyltransferase [Liparis tanakae]